MGEGGIDPRVKGWTRPSRKIATRLNIVMTVNQDRGRVGVDAGGHGLQIFVELLVFEEDPRIRHQIANPLPAEQQLTKEFFSYN